MNKVILKGNLCFENELKFTNSNKKYLQNTIACKDTFKKDTSHFIPIRMWEKTAEFVNTYFSKGSEILIEGNLNSYEYEKDGKKIKGLQVEVTQVEFSGGKKDSTPKKEEIFTGSNDNEELPF